MIVDVQTGSNAARFGFQPRDFLLAVNETALSSVAEVKAALAAAPPAWRIKISRDGQTLSLTVNP